MKKYYLYTILLLVVNAAIYSQNTKLDTNLIEQIKSATDSVSFELAKEKYRVNIEPKKEYDNSMVYARLFLEIAKRNEYDRGIGYAYNLIGNIYNITEKHSEAIKYYNKAIIYFKKVNCLRGLAIINNNISIIEQERGNLEKSANHLLDAKLYNERLKDSFRLSQVYNNLGNVYGRLGDFESAKKYFSKTIIIKRKKNLPKLGTSLNNLALAYIKEKKLDTARTILLEALETCKKNKNYRSLANSYSILGELTFTTKEFQISKKYSDSALIDAQKTKYYRVVTTAKQQLALIAINTKNYQEAERNLVDARNDLEKTPMSRLLLKNYHYSAMLDSARGNFSNAYVWQKKYQKLSDQSLLDDSALKIQLAENRFKAEMEQLKRIDEQEKREQKTAQQLIQYRIFAFISLGVVILVLCFLTFFIKSRRERKRYIEQLAESNQVKNKLFSIISHDLKNEIHGLDGSLNLLKNNTITEEEFKTIVPLLANRTHQTSILLNNLLNWSKSQMKELNAKPVPFDITDIIHNKFSFFEPKAQQKKIRLINKLNPTKVFADKDMFSIVTQNLIANAIKFCNPGDSITLSSREKNGYYEISFQDTGVGIDPANIDKLFAEDTFTTNGTQQETGTGLGLRICSELINLNKGKIRVQSILGVGSTFSILLPIASEIALAQAS
ncbi:tetratricopeptide repeat-containing sensor histidine kinase [Aquimarina pacifica]|uniref:tetratricopeptide repeat-containing sensor histidine kinase n=1 Tax=Aquimarina pacifica TaxID=1296415 RepID=UPI0004708FF9|nr:tetratricopeptide repeat protein [Aquimarina pacifica]